MIKETIKISGMSCSHCVKSVEKEVSKLALERFEVSIGELKVEYAAEKVSREQIIEAVQEAGYAVYHE